MDKSVTSPGVDVRATAAASVTVLLWASAFVVIRDSIEQVGPGALALGRLAVASLLLTGLLLWRREGLPDRAAWPGILGSGLLWLGLYMVTLNWGEKYVDAGTASLIVLAAPIFIALLGGWLLHEGFPVRLLSGMAVSFVGTAIVGFSMSEREDASAAGVLLCLLAAGGFAGGMVSQKFALRHATPLQITTFGCLVASVATLPFVVQLAGDVADSPGSAMLSIAYLGVLPTALAFSTWAYALARIPAGRLSSTTYAVPAVTVALSWAFLAELPPLLAFAGGALCLAGVAVSRSRAPLRRSASATSGSLQPAGGAEAVSS